LILKSLLDDPDNCFELRSPRGFTCYTGAYKGVRVSVMATGMGGPMMDFAVRESRAIVEGPMVMIRLGSCGGVAAAATPGVVVANTPGSVRCSRNVDCEDFSAPSDDCYLITKNPATPDEGLASALAASLRKELGNANVVEGLNCSADSFYDAQWRKDPNFKDANTDVLARLQAMHGAVASVEMESFYLLHLAKHAKRMKAASCAVVAANRISGAVVDRDAFKAAERAAGVAVLSAVAAAEL